MNFMSPTMWKRNRGGAPIKVGVCAVITHCHKKKTLPVIMWKAGSTMDGIGWVWCKAFSGNGTWRQMETVNPISIASYMLRKGKDTKAFVHW